QEKTGGRFPRSKLIPAPNKTDRTYPRASGPSSVNAGAPPGCPSAVTTGNANTSTRGASTNQVQTRDVGRFAPSTAMGGVSARTAARYQKILPQTCAPDPPGVTTETTSQVSQTKANQGQNGASAVPS